MVDPNLMCYYHRNQKILFSGLALSLRKSCWQHDSSNFKFNQYKRHIEIGSDGASPNLALCALEKEAVGDHLVFT